MANQELRVGDIAKDAAALLRLLPGTIVAYGGERRQLLRRHADTVYGVGWDWTYPDDPIAVSGWERDNDICNGGGLRVLSLPAPAAEYPLCTRCDEAEVAAGCRCPKCGEDMPPAAECAGCGFSEGDMCIVCMDRGQAAQIAPPAPPPPPRPTVACWNCQHPRVTGFACPMCLQFEKPAPRCAPGCTPAQPCRAMGPQGQGICPVFHENWVDTNGMALNVGLDRSDIPPAREPRIGALSWSHATVCGGLSTRRGR